MKRVFSRAQVANRIGVHIGTVDLAVARGWLTAPSKRHQHGTHLVWRWSDLVAFVQTHYCWLVCPPTDIADPALRAYAMTARAKMHRFRWYSSTELQAHYCLSHNGISSWRKKGWPTQGGEWVHYAPRYWLWTDMLPPPAEPLPSPGRIRATEQFAARRQSVVAAVMATGTPPTSGAQNGWPREQWEAIAAPLGMHWRTVREHWLHARRRNEITVTSGACPKCGKVLRTTRVCGKCAKGCSVPGCTERHEAHGLCHIHYMRWLKTRQHQETPCAAD